MSEVLRLVNGRCPACRVKQHGYKRDRFWFCMRCDRAFDMLDRYQAPPCGRFSGVAIYEMTPSPTTTKRSIEEMKERITPAALQALVSGNMENFIAATTQGGIERQEAAGQAAFVGSDTLPLRFNYCTREQFEKMGIVFGEAIDDLFQQAILPTGWTKISTDHSMWSKLVDDKGRERAAIFYKAAFYDRSAFIGLTSRFSIRQDYERDKEGWIVFQVKDGDVVIFSTAPVVKPDDKWWITSDEQRLIAGEWLKLHFPDSDDPTAYWD